MTDKKNARQMPGIFIHSLPQTKHSARWELINRMVYTLVSDAGKIVSFDLYFFEI